MQRHKLYKHKNNTDVAILIHRLFYVSKKHSDNPRYKLKIEWVNIGPHPYYCMNIFQNIEILDKNVKDWELTEWG